MNSIKNNSPLKDILNQYILLKKISDDQDKEIQSMKILIEKNKLERTVDLFGKIGVSVIGIVFLNQIVKKIYRFINKKIKNINQ